ncbi:hypothetical protein CDO44_23545 [Pigmentiphaga sp. NML080357]|uniref:DUF2149 domain-containing protein n=1 Tax=Pigmentiphaga sp. NML080357 TaxID=2008675 RepID=UPI000B408676|nr:DUF2149 domain-containing protein [Pigmentiphaga sp. NML080357]OVZ55211.1 hypothetical protein CDO44_23545 [Pigmentiphaga sp. NML080357]
MRRGLRFARARRARARADDPLAGVANLFDASLAFIVAMAVALFSVLGAQDLFSEDASWTLTRTTRDGQLEVVRKDKKQIKVERVSDRELSGEGQRLGVAYQLPDGQVVYVPEGGTP